MSSSFTEHRLTFWSIKQKRMKEVDNLESIKEEWVCETGSDHQPLSDSQQTNCEYFVDSLFEEAQKVGAKCLSPTEQKKQGVKSEKKVKSLNRVRLCDPVDCSLQGFSIRGILQVDVSIKLWKNGFTVNDDFRSYSDGASQQFLNSIKKGELPLELQGVFDKEEVDVKVEDKKNEICMSTKPVFQPFSGQGHRLGSATPKIVSKAKNIEVENKNKLSTVPLNNLEPITNIQIWLANGKRIVQKFNISHRISHIKDFIEKYQGSQRSPPFSLATALPFLKLLDETLTLEEADLQNAVIIQRLKKTAEPFKELS
ncbi:UBX domain-containing protein 2A isoform 2-T2 [Dama dama]|uniref:UBX domain-containing protein 2A isoform X2 n=1 Tax=Dama dama TaxID=30532 RepID=UPI002A36B32A|nr:UBX domain-containing protein 2A isoform X2 [Dama dama]XP_061010880.1 UBX domain-containing protein 2A isoform X2 [Dama dama]